MIVRMGRTSAGQALAYDETLYEFRLDQSVTPYEELVTLDAQGGIHWIAMEQRDWFRKIDATQLQECNQRALQNATYDTHVAMDPHDQVRTDAARDDSIIAGKIVDADPALVQAVIEELEKQGVAFGMGGAGPNPLATADLPKGMEALSQFERAQTGERKMTRSEERLMKKILKNDDKEKARREKEAAAIAEANEKAEEKEQEKREKATGADGNIDFEETSEEEMALLEMRQRNLEQNMRMQTPQAVFSGNGVPGSGRTSSFATNPDGSPKNTGMMGQLNKRKKLRAEKRQVEQKMGGKKAIRKRRKQQEQEAEQQKASAGGNYSDTEAYAANSRFGSAQAQGAGMGGGMGGGPGGGMGGGMGMGGGAGMGGGGMGMGGQGGGAGMGGGQGGGAGMGGGQGGGMGGGGGGTLSTALNVAQQVLRIVSSLTGGGRGGGGGGGGGGM